MTREEIYNKLQYGDYILIAQKTGKRSETVRSQIVGRRTLKDNVRDAAIELITVREKIEQEFINPNNK
jgi:hypothetical protein